MVQFLELTLDDMRADAIRKYGTLDLDGLADVLKSLNSNYRYQEAVDIAMLSAHQWITDGRWKKLEANNPEFTKAHEFETKLLDRQRIKDGKIEKYQVKMYRLVHDMTEDYEGRDISELEVIQHMDIDPEDQNLEALEIIKKYAISENLDGLKRAKASAKFEASMLKVAEAVAALQNHKTKIAVVKARQATLRAENAATLVRSRAGFLNAEGRKLFGL